MPQNAAGADDQVVNKCGYSVDLGGADKGAERVVLRRYLPKAGTRLRKVKLATRAAHDGVVCFAVDGCEAQRLPERDSGLKVVNRSL